VGARWEYTAPVGSWQEGLGDALEREGGPEHRIPLTRRERARGELRGAAVGHPCDDAQAFGQAGLLRRVGADVPEHAARELHGRQHVRVDVQLLQHLGRPAQADQVVAGLERVAGVGGDRVPDELRRDHVGLVGEASTVAQHAFVAPPQQLGQCPRGLDPVTQPVPQGVACLLRLGRERAGPGVVVHQPGRAGGAVRISDQHGAEVPSTATPAIEAAAPAGRPRTISLRASAPSPTSRGGPARDGCPRGCWSVGGLRRRGRCPSTPRQRYGHSGCRGRHRPRPRQPCPLPALRAGTRQNVTRITERRPGHCKKSHVPAARSRDCQAELQFKRR
jgi:hypothetical protein